MYNDDLVVFMEESIKQMEMSLGKTKVGAVIVIDGKIISTGFKNNETHAERMAINKALDKGHDLKKAIMFTTLEPCVETKTNQKKQCCADLINEVGIKTVYIGSYDNNSSVYRKGWRTLRDNGVILEDYNDNLIEIIKEKNKVFIDFFYEGIGLKGGAKVNHKDQAYFNIQLSEKDNRKVQIQWSTCGKDSAYISAILPAEVANARYAHHFDEIKNPNVFEFNYTVKVAVNEIGIYKFDEAFVLLKPREIKSGPDYDGVEDYYVLFDYEVRIRN